MKHNIFKGKINKTKTLIIMINQMALLLDLRTLECRYFHISIQPNFHQHHRRLRNIVDLTVDHNLYFLCTEENNKLILFFLSTNNNNNNNITGSPSVPFRPIGFSLLPRSSSEKTSPHRTIKKKAKIFLDIFAIY